MGRLICVRLDTGWSRDLDIVSVVRCEGNRFHGRAFLQYVGSRVMGWRLRFGMEGGLLKIISPHLVVRLKQIEASDFERLREECYLGMSLSMRSPRESGRFFVIVMNSIVF